MNGPSILGPTGHRTPTMRLPHSSPLWEGSTERCQPTPELWPDHWQMDHSASHWQTEDTNARWAHKICELISKERADLGLPD